MAYMYMVCPFIIIPYRCVGVDLVLLIPSPRAMRRPVSSGKAMLIRIPTSFFIFNPCLGGSTGKYHPNNEKNIVVLYRIVFELCR